MTKELVEEATGRPGEEKEVIEEAKRLFDRIKSSKKNIEHHINQRKHSENSIKEDEHKIELLKRGKYRVNPSPYRPGGFDVEYFEEKYNK